MFNEIKCLRTYLIDFHVSDFAIRFSKKKHKNS